MMKPAGSQFQQRAARAGGSDLARIAAERSSGGNLASGSLREVFEMAARAAELETMEESARAHRDDEEVARRLQAEEDLAAAAAAGGGGG